MATKKRGLQYTDEQVNTEQTEVLAEALTKKEKTLADVFSETKEGDKISLRVPGKNWWRYTRSENGYDRDVVPGFNPGPEHSTVNPEDFAKYEWRY